MASRPGLLIAQWLTLVQWFIMIVWFFLSTLQEEPSDRFVLHTNIKQRYDHMIIPIWERFFDDSPWQFIRVISQNICILPLMCLT